MYYYLTIFNNKNQITLRLKSKLFIVLIHYMISHKEGFAFTTFPFDDQPYSEY